MPIVQIDTLHISKYCSKILYSTIPTLGNLKGKVTDFTRPIKSKLNVEHPEEKGTKVYIHGLSHMTKMAPIATNSKHL